MAVRSDFLLRALLKWNYFPTQKKRKDELPPVFVSADLTKDIAEQINRLPVSADRKKTGGFDCVGYYATRFNNVPRPLRIPHPKPYSDLCLQIYNNWRKIRHICTNANSMVRPQKHLDGRTIIMDYESSFDRRRRYNSQAFGKRYIVKTDIANFYPSLYSHAIPWALVGMPRAKRDRRDSSKWFNKIDASLRECCCGETAGVPIGPATSNIMAEVVLERVDRVLNSRFSYVRFIDDYTAYCETEDQADEFIRELGDQLREYRLNLNINKTEICRLPQSIDEQWVIRLKELVPQDASIGPSQVSNTLEAALILQKDNPDGSVLKYAVNSIAERLDGKSSLELLKYAIKLCLRYPVLIPALKRPLEIIYSDDLGSFEAELRFLLDDSIKYRRSDATAWLLYYLRVFHSKIPAHAARAIADWGDCMALTLLAEDPDHRKKAIRFANRLDRTDLYELDRYWPLLFQLFRQTLISNPYSNDGTFDVLKTRGVSFVRF